MKAGPTVSDKKGNAKRTGIRGVKAQEKKPAAKPAPTPLTFTARPNLNFIFGHQLASTPKGSTRQPTLVHSGTASTFRTVDDHVERPDLCKFLNPLEPKEDREIPKLTINLNDYDETNGKSTDNNNATSDQVDNETDANANNNKAGGAKEADDAEPYVEIDMASDSQQDGSDELSDGDLEIVKKQLNERAEISQKTTVTMKGTTEPPVEGKDQTAEQKKLEELVDKMRQDMLQYKAVVEQNNQTIKTMNSEYEKAKERYGEEIADLRERTEKAEKTAAEQTLECTRLKDRVKEFSSVLLRAAGQLSEVRGVLKTYTEVSNEAMRIVNDASILDAERLVKYQLTINYACQLSHKVNLTKLDETLKYIKELTTPAKLAERTAASPHSQPAQSKYEHLLQHIRAENAVLYQQAAELEKVVGTIQGKKEEDVRRSIQEAVTVRTERDQWQQKYAELKEQYTRLLNRPTPQARVGKLAQILAYLPKRRREIRISEEKYVFELQVEINRLKKELADKDEQSRRREEELRQQINGLLSRLQEKENEKANMERENAALRQKVAELMGIIRLKDQQIAALRKDLELARQQIEDLLSRMDKLVLEAHNKDLAFAEKMKEMKGIFDEMRKEKEDKQKEIQLLRQRIAELEKLVASLRAALDAANAQIQSLTSENERLEIQLEKYMSPEAMDGFRALVMLANMILARTKRPPALSLKDRQLIKDIFDSNTREMLEEIGRLEQEGKIMREEIRKLLSERAVPRSAIKLLWESGKLPKEKEAEVARWLEESQKTEAALVALLDSELSPERLAQLEGGLLGLDEKTGSVTTAMKGSMVSQSTRTDLSKSEAAISVRCEVITHK